MDGKCLCVHVSQNGETIMCGRLQTTNELYRLARAKYGGAASRYLETHAARALKMMLGAKWSVFEQLDDSDPCPVVIFAREFRKKEPAELNVFSCAGHIEPDTS